MQIVDSVEIETIERILQIGCGKYETCTLRKAGGNRQAVDIFHLYVKEYYVGALGVDDTHPLGRIGEGKQRHPSEPFAEFLDDIKGKNLIIDCHTFYSTFHIIIRVLC